MKKVGIIILILLCIIFAILTGCATNKEKIGLGENNIAKDSIGAVQDEVTLKFMQYTASGAQEETLNEMIVEFQKRNPNIKIKVESLAFNDYFTKLATVLASKSAVPDVFELGYENFMMYAAKNVLDDLSTSIAKDKDFDLSIYKKLAYDAFNYDGKQYGVCESYSDCVMVYNKTLFDEKGVDYPVTSWTWKEELEAAQKLTDAEKGIWGTYSPIQFWEFYKTIVQNGGSIWSEDHKTVTINSKECVEALQWMLDKARVYKVSPPLNDDTFAQADADVNAFKEGKLAMFRTGIWNFEKFKDMEDEWDIVLEPGNTQKAHQFFADGLVASNQTGNTDAKWKFIKFMSSDDYVVSKRIETGWGLPAVNNDDIMQAYYKQTPPNSKKVITDALDSLVLPPVGPIPEKWNDLATIVGDEIEKVQFGVQDVQTALDDAKVKIEALLE